MKSHLLPFILAASAVILSTAQASEPSHHPVVVDKDTVSLPSLVGPIANQTLPVTSGSIVVGDLDRYFTGKDLTYSISIAGDAVTTFSFDSSNVLCLTPLDSAGTATMTVTATDGSQRSIQTSFTVTVNPTMDSGYSLTQIE